MRAPQAPTDSRTNPKFPPHYLSERFDLGLVHPDTKRHVRMATVRDLRVILDTELPALYWVSTQRFNEAVTRSLTKFPADFLAGIRDDPRHTQGHSPPLQPLPPSDTPAPGGSIKPPKLLSRLLKL